ncbi:PEP-CTERM sorting domain-containing protein [Paraglaciecola arctica]|uniref:Ice-binding protein C-terminal domain-containing protein n=1 Tax=Paraglaciecola arctica BSs20135 TaxID=493475 RepID=K6XZN4_9ALTE|nr:PEP-CTERM sorting domain-containing protein [Paraglaciecola arctica]GAC17126.1 hypothetical protein GARC_0144 [Paraglaciecola arctica BSs20135]
MKVVSRIVLAVSFMFVSIANAEIILSFDPSTQVAQPGSTVSVTVMIEGLGNGIDATLGAYDLWIGFDTSVLSFTGYSLFDNLGGVADSLDLSWGDTFDPNLVNIAETSYLSDAELAPFQPASFALAELFFTINPFASAQTTDLFFDSGAVFNSAQLPTAFTLSGINASIDVPAPATLALMGLGLLTLFVRQKRYSSSFKKS